jgi:LMBR1 domain-containing protein 1
MVDYGVYIVVAIVVGCLVLVGCTVFIIKMQHPDDSLTAWLPKIIVLIGLFLTCSVILLLPFDASMSQSCDQDPRCPVTAGLAQTWYFAFLSVAIMAFGVIPVAYFWYETDEDDGVPNRICTTICWSCVFMIVFVSFLLGMYFSIGYVELPVELVFPPGYNASSTAQNYLKKWDAAKPPVPLWTALTDPKSAPRVQAIQNIQTSIVIYILALLSFIGWFLLSLFAGMGLIAVPMDLLSAWWNRPVPIDLKKFAEKKLELKKRCDELLTIGRQEKEKYRVKKNRFKERRFTNKYKKLVLDLEDEIEVWMRFIPFDLLCFDYFWFTVGKSVLQEE